MNRRGALIVGLLMLPFLRTLAQAEPVVVSIQPALDLPIPPDHLLYRPSGGIELRARSPVPSLPLLSVGAGLSWNLGRMRHTSLSQLGTLSLLAGEAAAELRFKFRRPVDLFLGGGAGWFYAFLNEGPSQRVTGFSWSARGGVGYRLTPSLTTSITAGYHQYLNLYHFLGIALGVALRLPGG